MAAETDLPHTGNAISVADAYKRIEKRGWGTMIITIGEQSVLACSNDTRAAAQPEVVQEVITETSPEQVDTDYRGLGSTNFLYSGTDSRQLARVLNILIAHPSLPSDS